MSGRRRGDNLASCEFHRILLVKPSSLGDVIHTLPVLHGLRVRYPNAKIDWLIGSAFAPILEDNADLSEAILFDRRKFARLGRSRAVTGDFLRLVRELRARRYDLVIDLQGLFRSGFLAWATGASARIGFAKAREGAAFFYTHKIPPGPSDEHAVDRYMSAGRLLGFADVPAVFDLALDDATREQAAVLLREHGLLDHEPFVAIAPGARWETKLWPAQNFTRAVSELVGKQPLRCVLLGGAEDSTLCGQIISGCGNGAVISLAGKTTIRQMAAILERAAVVLCHDSAPMHVAAALGRPLVCLSGPTNPARTGPYRRRDDVLQLPLPCSPCYFRKLSQCPHDHRCMRDLTVDSVVARVRAAVNGQAQ